MWKVPGRAHGPWEDSSNVTYGRECPTCLLPRQFASANRIMVVAEGSGLSLRQHPPSLRSCGVLEIWTGKLWNLLGPEVPGREGGTWVPPSPSLELIWSRGEGPAEP